MKFYIYDLETFLTCFLFIGKHVGSNHIDVFELSDRKFQRTELLTHLSSLQSQGVTMVGYNSLGFDYPIIHELLHNPYTFNQRTGYLLGQQIIQNQEYGFTQIRPRDRLIQQIDLAKIHHFDSKARRTSLKSLQFAMRSESVEDLPYDPHSSLTNEQMDNLVSYGCHDVTETEKFFLKSKQYIEIRQELLDNGVLTGDIFNYSDVKLGVEYLVNKIGRAKCYTKDNKPKQSFRTTIPFDTIILPKIQFRTELFDQVLTWFKTQSYTINAETKPELEMKLAGLKFFFGLGGVHASVERKVYKSNATHVIKDIDVSGMYVAIAIANGFYPEHLGQAFSDAYKQLQHDRKQYPKGSAMNLVLKLAGNGVYGKSSDIYSCFYDPKYTYSVTINGQLQLLQLVEVLSLIPGLEIIQANTDGVTLFMPRELEPFFDLWCRDWEQKTGLKLEENTYNAMWIRDVNNYLAVDIKGVVKRKGAYWYPETETDYNGSGSGSAWNKDFSNMVVQKAIEQVLVNNLPVWVAVRIFTDPFDFMLRYKTTGESKVFIGDKECSKTVRYYISLKGQPIKKVAPPKGEPGTWKRKNGISDEFYNRIVKEIAPGVHDIRIHTKNKSVHAEVTTSIESGKLVRNCNKAQDFNWADLDYSYYENEVKKLIL